MDYISRLDGFDGACLACGGAVCCPELTCLNPRSTLYSFEKRSLQPFASQSLLHAAGKEIAKIALREEYAMFEEALAIYKKFSLHAVSALTRALSIATSAAVYPLTMLMR